ncbi:type I polyketide synthase [Streptomyces sp. NPDC058231]|uniref:type I polyketide synthase n=1 Tax=Streptomyces sp. NPDC058231 TaxID=3346392 RepID=UPI0036EED2B1
MAGPAQSTTDACQHDDEAATRIAVIGLACRFPGARDADELWRNLLSGTDSVTRRTGPEGVAARGLLDSPEWFDAGYFGVSPREARVINPQQRVLLECAVTALENAGYDPARHPGRIGVYAGSSENEYAQILKAQRAQLPSVSDWEIRVANGPDFLCSRIAHKLGLRGPAVTVQAACATSLVAVHLAVRGLLDGDCDLALAGGVTVRVPFRLDASDEVGIQAPDGVARVFDAGARGVVGGDGAGIVVLKRLADALADGDRVDAVIRGSAVNNDGADRIGFTAPGVDGQAAVIEQAQRAAGIEAGSCTYVEAHGTGTPLGDPVELAALTQAFRRDTERRGFCGIGSVKTNIGHTDAAAGVAGLIKTVLAVKHGVIPPSLHFTVPNPEIDFETSPFRVVTRRQDWQPQGVPRRGGVSSFGAGGTNAHVVVEQPPVRPDPEPADLRWQLLPLSARTPTALDTVTGRLAEHLGAEPGQPLAGVAWTLQAGRREQGHRRFAVVRDHADAVRVLTGDQSAGLITADRETRSRPLLLRFPATVDPLADRDTWARLQGSEPVFRHAAGDCGAQEAFKDGGNEPGPLVAFAGQYALACLWQHWGAEPAAVAGEGIGALVAATVAGVFRPADAARLAVQAAAGPETSRLTELIGRIGPRAPRIPLGAAAGGRRTSSAQATDPAYWAERLRMSWRPGDPAPALPDDPDRTVLDVEAGRVPGDEQGVLRVLGQLWLSGARIDWAGVHEGRPPRRVALPAYPFERQRHLVEAAVPGPDAGSAAVPVPAWSAGAGTLDRVAALFAEILDLPDVEPDDSFFDLGGDSLIATQFVARARLVFPVELVPRTLFEAPTAAELAALIDERAAAGGER